MNFRGKIFTLLSSCFCVKILKLHHDPSFSFLCSIFSFHIWAQQRQQLTSTNNITKTTANTTITTTSTTPFHGKIFVNHAQYQFRKLNFGLKPVNYCTHTQLVMLKTSHQLFSFGVNIFITASPSILW